MNMKCVCVCVCARVCACVCVHAPALVHIRIVFKKLFGTFLASADKKTNGGQMHIYLGGRPCIGTIFMPAYPHNLFPYTLQPSATVRIHLDWFSEGWFKRKAETQLLVEHGMQQTANYNAMQTRRQMGSDTHLSRQQTLH